MICASIVSSGVTCGSGMRVESGGRDGRNCLHSSIDQGLKFQREIATEYARCPSQSPGGKGQGDTLHLLNINWQ